MKPTDAPLCAPRRLLFRALLMAMLAMALAWTGARWWAARSNAAGLEAVGRRDYAEARAAFAVAHRLAPGHAAIAANLVYACDRLGRFDEAAAVARAMARREPARAGNWTERADAFARAGELAGRARARVARMHAEGWEDDDADLATTRDVAETLFQLGRYGDAIIVFERALFKDPTDWELEAWIEELERRVRDGEALTDDPDGPRAVGLGGADEALRIVPGR